MHQVHLNGGDICFCATRSRDAINYVSYCLSRLCIRRGASQLAGLRINSRCARNKDQIARLDGMTVRADGRKQTTFNEFSWHVLF